MIFNKSNKWAEVFCAYAINNYIFKDKDFTVGDCTEKHLPDIYDNSLSLGVEVVQLEKASDLDLKYVWKAYNDYDGDYYKILNFCNKKYNGTYKLTNYNGKMGSIKTKNGAHDNDWMKDIYTRNINTKLSKLNKGNYSGVKEKFLCASIIQRAKDLYDVNLILYIYLSYRKKFCDGYDGLIVVTSEKLYIINLKNIEDFPFCLSQNIISQININGENYLNIIDYDFDICNRLAIESIKNLRS